MGNKESFIHPFCFPKINHPNLSIYRLDLLHPLLQGNKYFKLKYNIEIAKEKQFSVVSFGGPFSNHLHATAISCKEMDIPFYAVIRGKSFKIESPTIRTLKNLNAKILYSSFDNYRRLRVSNYSEPLVKSFFSSLPKKVFIIPEGGSNELGVKGAEEILNDLNLDYDIIVLAVGSGGTIAGIINHLKNKKQVLGIPTVMDTSLYKKIEQLIDKPYKNWHLNYSFHFGGFGKWDNSLIEFINQFKNESNIPLCPLYTGKMMYAVQKMILNNKISKTQKILCIHTGGLQGIQGFNLLNKNCIN